MCFRWRRDSTTVGSGYNIENPTNHLLTLCELAGGWQM